MGEKLEWNPRCEDPSLGFFRGLVYAMAVTALGWGLFLVVRFVQ
jgi:hypothetical protein